MNKTERLSFIENLIKNKSVGRVEVDAAGIEEEKNLALANDSDSSIEDEENSPFVSPALVGATEKLRPMREDGEESFLLTAKEKSILCRELGKQKLFSGLKVAQPVGDEGKVDMDSINIEELVNFANAS
jgi:hypothetical protein